MQFDLEAILDELGVDNVRVGEKEITASCPMHPSILGRADRHASWSINRETGAHNCFSCGWKGGLTTLYRDLTGSVPDDVDVKLQHSAIKAALDRPERPRRAEQWDFPEWLGPVPQRLLDLKGIHSGAAEMYGLRWDPQERRWVLPICDEFGLPVGAQYRQVGSVLTQPTGLEKGKHLFGLSCMRGYSRITLVESPLDAVRLFSVNVPAVASLGAWVSMEQCRLLARYFSFVVLALDNDPTGNEAAQRTADRLASLGCPTIRFDYTGLPGKDPGDVEDDDLLYGSWKRTISIL